MHSPSRDCQINAKFMYRKSGKIHDRLPCGFLSFFPSSTVSAFSVHRPQTLHLSHDQDFDNARTRTELHARVIESCKISTTLTNFTITNIKPSPESQSRCEQNKPMVRQTVNMQLVSSIRYNTTASCERATATATAICFKVDGNEVYRIIITNNILYV